MTSSNTWPFSSSHAISYRCLNVQPFSRYSVYEHTNQPTNKQTWQIVIYYHLLWAYLYMFFFQYSITCKSDMAVGLRWQKFEILCVYLMRLFVRNCVFRLQDCHRPPVTEDVNDPRFVWYCCKCAKNLKKIVSITAALLSWHPCLPDWTWRIACTSSCCYCGLHVWRTVWVKNPPPLKFTDIFFPKRLEIFSPNFTRLLYVPIYAGVQIFIQLAATLTKLCHIKRDHRNVLKMSTIDGNSRWLVALNMA